MAKIASAETLRIGLCLTLACLLAMAVGMTVAPGSASAAQTPTLTLTRANTGKLTMKKGATYKIKAKASAGKIAYKSSSSKKVSVSKKGVIKAKKTGSATVTVTAKLGAKKAKKKIKVTVVKASKFKKVKKLAAKASASTLTVGATAKVTVGFSPKKASNKNLLFASSNKSVATVSENGVITAKKAGSATITVTSCDNSKAKAKIAITVKQASKDVVGELVERMAEGDVEVTMGPHGTVESICGDFTDRTVKSATDAAALLNDASELFGGKLGATAAQIDVRTAQATTGALSFYRFTPKVGGVSAEGSQIILGVRGDGTVCQLSSSYDAAVAQVDATAAFDQAEAIRMACALAAEAGSWNASELVAAAKARLAISTAVDGGPALVYCVDVAFPDSSSATYYLYANDSVATAGSCAFVVDWDEDALAGDGAQAGGVLEPGRIAPLASAGYTDQTFVANDKLGVARAIDVEQDQSGTYRMRDDGRNIETYLADFVTNSQGERTATYPGSIVEFTTSADAQAVSLHANMRSAYDYYRQNLGRNSFDGKGALIRASYGDTAWHNACWSPGIQQFKFGSPSSKNYVAALDIVGHEFTHAVVNYVVGDGNGSTLTYQDESGALNEAYADIMGTFIEQKDRSDSGYWLHGEDAGQASRSLSDPSSIAWSQEWKNTYGMDGYPTVYSDRYTGAEDRGGVHLNSGIFNRAAYLMVTDARCSDLSDVQWARVYYLSLFLLPNDATFEQAREAVLMTAWVLGFSAQQLQAIREAYVTVGIGPDVNTEESLRALLQAQTSEPILNFYFDDFDRDKDFEAFAVTGEGSADWLESGTIWYVDQNGARVMQSSVYGYSNGLLNSKGFKFFSFELSAYGSGSTSLVFGSRFGTPRKMTFTGKASWTGSSSTYTWNSGNVMGFSDASGDAATSTVSGCFVNGFHEYPTMRFVLDPLLFRFKLTGYDPV